MFGTVPAGPSYVSPGELATALQHTPGANDNDTPLKQPLLVIDVRDDDYAGGHIRGAVNLPTDHFEDDDDVDELVQRYRDAGTIVFHCMMSQVRGPSCARRFFNRLALLEDDADVPDVRVLAGGYQQFARIYDQDETLIEKE